MTTESFLKCERWLNGPDFLKQPQHSWPKLPEMALSLSDDDLEIKKIVAVSVRTSSRWNVRSSHQIHTALLLLDHLKRATARMLQFKDFLKQLTKGKRDMTFTGQPTHNTHNNKQNILTYQNLSVEDLARAEKSLLQYVQRHHFPEEISMLEKGKTPVKSSRLRKLDPILVDGVLRVGGRLNKTAMPKNSYTLQFYPSLHVTKLLIDILTSQQVMVDGIRHWPNSAKDSGYFKPMQLHGAP